MFCTNCGTQGVEGSAHCTNCGTRVDGVGTAAAIVGQAARNAYATMDGELKKSLIFGGGSLFAAIVTILLLGSAPILVIIFLPATITLGIMGLNAGRDLKNCTGYYLGMIGLISGIFQLHVALILYAVKSMAESAMGSAAGALGRSMF